MTKALSHITELIKNNLDTLANNNLNLSLEDEMIIDNARIVLEFNLQKRSEILLIRAMAIDQLIFDAESMSIRLNGKLRPTDDYSVSHYHSQPINNAIHSNLLNEQMIKFADKCFQRFINNGIA